MFTVKKGRKAFLAHAIIQRYRAIPKSNNIILFQKKQQTLLIVTDN